MFSRKDKDCKGQTSVINKKFLAGEPARNFVKQWNTT
jgi:hypothetical protein